MAEFICQEGLYPYKTVPNICLWYICSYQYMTLDSTC